MGASRSSLSDLERGAILAGVLPILLRDGLRAACPNRVARGLRAGCTRMGAAGDFHAAIRVTVPFSRELGFLALSWFG